ncbi:MAG TPA: pantoate--beta-alanine ligase [Streptosporangiaceae bacterium]|nr:pantoate--beta-alanine ligase [Streptosporangiaceae bacterium]
MSQPPLPASGEPAPQSPSPRAGELAPQPPRPAVLRTRAELAAARPGLPAPVVLVPTMGALHAGHRALLRAARAAAAGGPGKSDTAAGGPGKSDAAGPSGSVIVSVFVNPLQFRPGEDLDRYPRTPDDDLAMCAQEGVRAVFAPPAAEMYPGGPPQVTVDPGPAGQVFEGEFRPGFFGGVLTVVLKLFHLVRPDVAVFGEKDAQQLALVRRMVADTNLDLVIEAVPTVRDADGLATSSRNRYLSAADRELALTLPRALRAGQALAGAGAEAALGAAREVLRGAPALAVDYVAVVDPRTFGPAGPGPALIVAAVTAGGTRLIDNVPVVLTGGQNTERDFRDAADH